MADSNIPEQETDKPAFVGLLARIRAGLTPVGRALASIGAAGAVAGGLVGYGYVWKTVRTDVLREGHKTQIEAVARPDIAPRLSLVVLPFANLNNDPEQDYFAHSFLSPMPACSLHDLGPWVPRRPATEFRPSDVAKFIGARLLNLATQS